MSKIEVRMPDGTMSVDAPLHIGLREVMGRHAGWIAAAGGLVEDHGIPVVILFPEIEFDQKKFLARVNTAAIGLIWNQREDRYSEIRTQESARTKKVEMSYIGG